jgi:DNA-3-methyladenine glycosylase
LSQLPRAFFDRPTVTVARELLGQRLVHVRNGRRLAGLITETEAYVGETDQACHARVGRTPRTAVMYERPGHAYIYFTYGMHWCLCFVTEPVGFPAAVLVRAMQPLEGVPGMRRRRGPVPEARLTDGPAKLTQAMGIDGKLNGHDLCARGARLYLERARLPRGARVLVGPRVGMGATPEPWHGMPWNFKLADS